MVRSIINRVDGPVSVHNWPWLGFFDFLAFPVATIIILQPSPPYKPLCIQYFVVSVYVSIY